MGENILEKIYGRKPQYRLLWKPKKDIELTFTKITNNKIEHVDIAGKGIFSSKYFISNADATQTMLTLVGEESINADLGSTLKSLEPSLSMFIIYLGISDNLIKQDYLYPDTNMWFIKDYDIVY